MPNLSQLKRDRMLAFLQRIKDEHRDDDDMLIALGEIESELTSKKYGLVWEQHEEAVDVMMRDNIPVFTEVLEREITAAPGRGYNFILEGDNLHSLRLLEKTHKGKIDLIYIDPPYNTGNKDFVYLNKRIKTPAEKIQAAVDGEMCAEQAEKLRIIRSHMNSLELCKANLESLILSTAQKFLPQLELVMTVPGIQAYSAIGIISEIGVDMSVFPTSKHLCSWAGLTPQNNESAGKKKTTRISRAGAYIKPLLVQCALAVCKSNKHPEIKNRYLSLRKRRGHKKAIIAIARMLLLPSITFSRRTSHTIRSYISAVTTLRQNTGRFPWMRLSSFYSDRAISLPPAPPDRLCYHIFSATARWSAFVRPFRDGD